MTRRYPLFLRRRDRLLALLGRTRTIGTRTVLEDISFDAYPGEAIGIVGENGSGKTTLLRAVAGISTPDAGTIRTDKPVAAILELGVGFHPEFTGRENAQLYGALLGVPEAAMTDRLEDIMAFAELGELVDQPLRTYSSGMSARLAFAVATNVDPKVLVVDEALAVGDGLFDFVELGDYLGRRLVNKEAVFGNEILVGLVENFVAEPGRFPGSLLRFEEDIAVFF